MRNGVVVVGSVNVDLVTRAPRLPAPGETLIGTTVERHPGGKGANQAAALARLGVPVSLVGAVGDDADGRFSLASLVGVDTSGVRTVDAPTGLALITVDEAGENTIVVVPGANAHAVAPAAVDGAALLVQLELPLPVVTAAVLSARGLVVLNAAPAQALPPALLAGVDVLVVNEGEALALSGSPSLSDAVAVLGSQVRQGVVVTLGADGCLVGAAAVPSPRVAAVDTVGAGDAFVAALTWGLLEGRDLLASATTACTAGALAVTRPGARSSPTRAELLGA